MIAVLTDVHFGVRNSNKMVFETMMGYFEEVFFPYLLENNIKDVICGGDLYHDRVKVDWFILQEVQKRFFQWFERNQVNFHVVVGNHDSVYRNTLSHHAFKETFYGFQYCKYYDTIQTVDIGRLRIAMIPWLCDEHEITLPKADICVGHFEIKSFTMTRGNDCTSGFELETFDQYKKVISGHFHIRSSKKNIEYIGNPFQSDWGDFNENKGFALLDETFQLTYVNNEFSPRHIKIVYDGLEDTIEAQGWKSKPEIIKAKDAVEIATHNYVKMITKNVKEMKKVDKLLSAMLAVSKNGNKIEVIDASDIFEDIDSESIEEQIRSCSTTKETIRTFIDCTEFEEVIDKERMNDIMIQLHDETLLGLRSNECSI